MLSRIIAAALIFFAGVLAPAFSYMGDNYVIGPGDVLEIRAWNSSNPDLLVVNPVGVGVVATTLIDQHAVTVSRDGRIYVPMVGAIKVEGKTIAELEDVLDRGLSFYLKGGKVKVLIKTPKTIKAYVMGEVSRPGMYGIPDGNAEELRVMNFINASGGFTALSDMGNIKILRKNGSSQEASFVDLRKLVSKTDIEQNRMIKDGDTIIVPQIYNQVYVLGLVNKPGPVPYVQEASIADYIAQAGGFAKVAASDSVAVLRGNPSSPTVIKVGMRRFFDWGKGVEEVSMLPGDIVYVPQSWYANFGDLASILIGFRDLRNATRDLATPSQWRIDFTK
ncbi:MAG: polysaccharide biosynthesis/export family protein [Candidatus Margulisiibacteriota bacterium]